LSSPRTEGSGRASAASATVVVEAASAASATVVVEAVATVVVEAMEVEAGVVVTVEAAAAKGEETTFLRYSMHAFSISERLITFIHPWFRIF